MCQILPKIITKKKLVKAKKTVHWLCMMQTAQNLGYMKNPNILYATNILYTIVTKEAPVLVI